MERLEIKPAGDQRGIFGVLKLYFLGMRLFFRSCWGFEIGFSMNTTDKFFQFFLINENLKKFEIFSQN